jgi:hypothetical protein
MTDIRSSGGDNRWFEQAASVLAHLGFELLAPEQDRIEHAGHLLVAIRHTPTQEHYDPESVDYWTSDGVKGQAARLDFETRYPLAAPFAWGRIVLADRLGVQNEFLSFGGNLKARTAQDGTIIVDFASRAPILRWGGHSQEPDPLAAEIGAYFGRLKVPIDFAPGAEELIAKAEPATLYCAFIQATHERLTRYPGFREANRWLAEWNSRESARMEAADAPHWQAGQAFARELAAVEAVARE